MEQVFKKWLPGEDEKWNKYRDTYNDIVDNGQAYNERFCNTLGSEAYPRLSPKLYVWSPESSDTMFWG
jgi:hypothetical protein